MKVILTNGQPEYDTILEYLHYKLPESLERKLSGFCIAPVFKIDYPEFECSNLHFKLKYTDKFQTFHNFRIYSELTIEGPLDKISEFISTAIDSISKNKFQQSFLVIYRSGYNGWNESKKLEYRKLESVYLPKGVKEDIILDLDNFYSTEISSIYSGLGINHNRVYMLYGLPGTGKTTLIKALGCYFKKNIAYLVIKQDFDFDNLFGLFERIPDNTFICLEDVDSLFNQDREQKTRLTFSAFINIFDGITTSKNLVIFMTTNNLNSLDKAIVRRISYFIEFKHATKEQIKEMFDCFFPLYIPFFDEVYSYIKGTDVTTNMVEKFFIKYLSENITDKMKFFSKFVNGELSLEKSNVDKLYM